jgi:hypothetical protein
VDPEKKSLRASERDEAARAAWRAAIAAVDPADLVVLDETGSHLGYTPTHAWAPRGERAAAAAPRRRGENKTIVAALTLDGIGPALRFDGARFRPGQVVVADNLRAHHPSGARAAIEARGARLLHLPPYLPGLQPDRARLRQAQAAPPPRRAAH